MVQFRFTQEAPDQQMLTDFQNLNNFNENQLAQFVDILMVFFTGQQASELMDTVGSFAQEHGINANALKNLIRALLLFFKGAVRANLTPLYVKEDLVNLGLTDGNANVVARKWKTNFIALSRSVIGQTLVVNEMLDMEWRFGVTTSNNELKKVGSTFVQLKLVLDKGNSTKENVYMELTLPQFYQFVHEMEQAKAHLEYFS